MLLKESMQNFSRVKKFREALAPSTSLAALRVRSKKNSLRLVHTLQTITMQKKWFVVSTRVELATLALTRAISTTL